MSVKSFSLPADIPFLPSRRFNVGMLSCLYEHGNLRHIRYDNNTVLQMIYTAVRNENWTTLPYTISNENVTESEGQINITYTASYELGDARYTADIIVEMTEHSILYKMQGRALSSFKKNRIGICILHPIAECAGTSALITQPDGTEYTAVFPVLINPHQPFTEIREMKMTTHGGVIATLAFSGDVFETEDQRNWSDNSFKTYSTRLTAPMPVQLNTGDKMEQQVSISFSSEKKTIPVIENNAGSNRRPFPKIGFAQCEDRNLSAEEISLLKKLPLDHLRIDLRLSNNRWKGLLQQAMKDAAELDTKIELAIFFSDNLLQEIEALAQMIGSDEHMIDSLLILHENDKIIHRNLYTNAHNYLRARFSKLRLGYGTNGFFVEINRNPPDGLEYDFITFSLTPQAHATDARTILENLESHQHILSTARIHADKKEIHISALTFGTGVDSDERQHSTFGAYWLLRSLYNLSPAAITLYATGPHGVLKNTESALFNKLSIIGEMKPKWMWMEENKVFLSE